MIASPRALAGAAAPGAGGQVIVDLDATIVISHSDKDHARPTWKKTYGFHPMTAFADHGPGRSGEPLAIMLRPGNAGSNTAADHIEAARLALAQLPAAQRRKVLIRADSGGGTPEFLTWLTRPSRRLQYSAGMVITAESIAIRILVPDTHRPWAFPCRADDQADEPAFRQRAGQTSRRHTNAISESGTRSAAPTIDPASAPRDRRLRGNGQD